jgi:hypothetical protein
VAPSSHQAGEDAALHDPAELAPEGGLLLRPAGVYPLEVYTEERLQELLAEDTLTGEERARLAALAR